MSGADGVSTRDFAIGAVVGLVVGVGGVLMSEPAPLPPTPAPVEAAAAVPPAAEPTEEQKKLAAALSVGTVSVAQQGEDIVLMNVFRLLEMKTPTYLDIGAYDPIISNNTYAFYITGSRGVLVEPNPTYYDKLKTVRPRDVTLRIGIGMDDDESADYYVIRDRPQLNTFSPDEVEIYKRRYGPDAVEEVLKMPLVNINKVIAEHFGGKAPDLISIDIEGLDLAILKTLDFERFRPTVLCVETLDYDSRGIRQETLDFLASKDYAIRGGSFVNTVFVDNEVLRSWAEKAATAPVAADEP